MAANDRAARALALGALLFGCGRVASNPNATDNTEESDGDGIPGDGDGDGDDTGGDGDGDGDGDDDGWGAGDLDLIDPTDDPGCGGDGACNQIDLLFVIDNSITMGRQQLILSSSLPLLLERLQMLSDPDGLPLHPDVNIAFTSTDVGHPECTSQQPEGYEPAQGQPQIVPCTERMSDFAMFPEACSSSCPVAVAPIDPFIHFAGPNAPRPTCPATRSWKRCAASRRRATSAVATRRRSRRCCRPSIPARRGTSATNRSCVSTPSSPSCSSQTKKTVPCAPPEGYAYFTDPAHNEYWEINPDTATKTNPTSAVCWNAGVNCGAPDANGVYADCQSIDNGVLHPVDRYLTYLRDELIETQNKEIVMLGILGVPHVSEHNDQVPWQPITGGVEELVYQESQDPSIEFEYGIGPGCTSEDGTYQALPPVRIKEVCESLDKREEVRCCIESICDSDYSDAMSCLTGILQTVATPIG